MFSDAESISFRGKKVKQIIRKSDNAILYRAEDDVVKPSVSVSVSYRNDNNNQDGNRPTEIPIELIVSGAIVIRTATLTPENNWSYTFSDLEDGISYQLSAGEIDFYDLDITKNNNDFIITADYLPPITSATIKISFDDVIPDYRPQSITATLNNGTEVNLTWNNAWSTNISNLPAVVNHETATYDWTIAQVPHYEIFQKTKNGNVTRFILKQLDNIPASITLEETDGKQILSYIDRETLPVTEFCELTATVMDENNNPLSNANVDFYKNDELWMPDIPTYSDGQAIATYDSEGAGDVEIYAKIADLTTDSYIIEDCQFYDDVTTNKASDYTLYNSPSLIYDLKPSNHYTFSKQSGSGWAYAVPKVPSISVNSNMSIEATFPYIGMFGAVGIYKSNAVHLPLTYYNGSTEAGVYGYGSTNDWVIPTEVTQTNTPLKLRLELKNGLLNVYVLDELEKLKWSKTNISIPSSFNNSNLYLGIGDAMHSSTSNFFQFKDVKIKTIRPINISVDNPILSYVDSTEQNPQIATLTATIPLQKSGKTVEIYKNNKLISTETTDSQGQVSYEYESQGLGDIEFEFRYGSVTETCTIEDCYYYNGQTYQTTSSSTKTLNKPIPSKCVISFENYVSSSSSYNSFISLGTNTTHRLGIGAVNSGEKYRFFVQDGDSTATTVDSNTTHGFNQWVEQTVIIDGNTVNYYDLTRTLSNTDLTNLWNVITYNGGIRNIKVKPIYSINVDVNNPILSYAGGEIAIFTATIQPAMSGKTVQVFKDDVLVATEITDSQGQINYEYESQGVGDVEFNFECGSITENYKIEDCKFYSKLTKSLMSAYFNKGSKANMSFGSDGMTSNASGGGNQDIYNHIICNIELPTNFEVEYKWMGGAYYTGNIWVDGLWWQSSRDQQTIIYNLYYDYSGQSQSSPNIEKNGLSSGDVFKFKKQGDSVSIYRNGELQASGSYTSHNLGHYVKIINCCGTTNRSTTITNLKIKSL